MKKDVYNLSKPQESIWLTEQYFKGSNINYIVTIIDFSSKVTNLNFDLLKMALNHMIKSNDNFQIRLFLDGGTIKQYFCDFEEIDFPIYEIDCIDTFLAEEAKKQDVFDILGGPLYTFKIFRLKGTNTGGIVANFHHLICDAYTTAISARQVSECYNSLVENGTLANINPDKFSYIEYLNSEKEYIVSDKFLKSKNYWDGIFKTIPEVATLPSIMPSQSSMSVTAERLTFTLDSNLTNRINELCTSLKISVYNFFMCIFGIYIGRASNLNDFVIGTPILNRTNFREKNTSGMFISTIPFRLSIDNNITFASFASKVSKDTLAMLRHQKYSYQYILENLREKDPSIPNLYNVMLSYQINKASDETSNYSTGWVSNNCSTDDLGISIYDVNTENIVNISYDYKISKYTQTDIKLLHPRILNIINQLLENPMLLIKDIEIATPSEKEQILHNFNNTTTSYPKDKTIISLFEEQVKLYPNDHAIFFEGNSLSYFELNKKANSLACFLRDSKNIKPKDIVGLLFDKSFEEIIAILAVLKLGAIYVPIDISYPKDRISYMLRDSNAKLVLTTSDVDTSSLPSDCCKVLIDLHLDFYQKNFSFDSFKNSKFVSIMYTSGSTGVPKGVMITNKGIIRLVRNTNYISFSHNDRILHAGSIAFDASTFEIYSALLNGLELFLIQKSVLLNYQLFEEFIKKNEVNIMLLTTSLFNKFCETNPNIFSNVKYLVSGGEVASIKHFSLVKQANTNIILENLYGPTENTVVSTYYKFNENVTTYLPIGRPISNSTCYIVSQDGMIMPPFVPGELWVGGDGVAFGYINRDELTSEKFIDNPFEER